MIRKLFTLGLNTPPLAINAFSATRAMLESILNARTMAGPKARPQSGIAPEAVTAPQPEASARGLIVEPEPQPRRLAELGAERRSFAA
jgi:hypothetical protein